MIMQEEDKQKFVCIGNFLVIFGCLGMFPDGSFEDEEIVWLFGDIFFVE